MDDEVRRVNRRLQKQLADAQARNRELLNENLALRTQVANLKLINPQGERLSSLLPRDTKAYIELEAALFNYAVACGGKPQAPPPRRARGAKKAR